MKKTMLLVLPLATLALACGGRNQGAPGGAASPPGSVTDHGAPAAGAGGSATMGPGGSSGTFMAEVVTVDKSGPSVTLRDGAGTGHEKTIQVEGGATSALDTVKKGDQVHVTCRPVVLGGGADATGAPGSTAAAGPGLASCETVTALMPMTSGGSMGR